MADAIHAILTPKMLKGPTEELTLSFDAPTTPESASSVVVQIFETDSWGSGAARIVEDNAGPDVMIAELKGKIQDGKFIMDSKTPKGKLGDKPELLLRIQGEGNVVHSLPFPAAALANEAGVYEIMVRVTGVVNKKKAKYTTPNPVFVRDFKAARPVITFTTGDDGDPRNPFFAQARAYWKTKADGVFDRRNLQSILKFLSADRGFGPWGEVNIVGHGVDYGARGAGATDNMGEFFLPLFSSAAANTSDPNNPTGTLKAGVITKAKPQPTDFPTTNLDDKTIVVLRGCEIGQDQTLMNAIKGVLGGKCTVMAPKFIQEYGPDASGSPRESFQEYFFYYLPGGASPDQARSAAKRRDGEDEIIQNLGAKYPGVNTNDQWRLMLHKAYPLRKDRTQFFNFTVGFNDPKHDFLGDVRTDFSKKDEQHFFTEFDDWKWREVGRRGDRQGNIFVTFQGTRRRVDLRRDLLFAGATVRPDLKNPKHYGKA